jgi:hypothetical protein
VRRCPLPPLGRARQDVGLMRGTGIHHPTSLPSIERSLLHRGP